MSSRSLIHIADPSSAGPSELDTLAGGDQNPVTLNRFVYALANPTTLTDPDGHMALGGCQEYGTCSSNTRETYYRARVNSSRGLNKALAATKTPSYLNFRAPAQANRALADADRRQDENYRWRLEKDRRLQPELLLVQHVVKAYQASGVNPALFSERYVKPTIREQIRMNRQAGAAWEAAAGRADRALYGGSYELRSQWAIRDATTGRIIQPKLVPDLTVFDPVTNRPVAFSEYGTGSSSYAGVKALKVLRYEKAFVDAGYGHVPGSSVFRPRSPGMTGRMVLSRSTGILTLFSILLDANRASSNGNGIIDQMIYDMVPALDPNIVLPPA